MANFTEKAIVETFVAMLNEQPLDKITVRALTQRCGISRNTFYYHFHGLYDLIDALFKAEEQRLLSDVADSATLREGLVSATRFAIENRVGIRHIYDSANRDQLAAYLYTAAEICIRPFIETQAADLDVRPEDREGAVFLYSSMLQGAVLNTLRTNMPQNADELVERACRMLEGTVRFALENVSAS